jgi:hypothetical protein
MTGACRTTALPICTLLLLTRWYVVAAALDDRVEAFTVVQVGLDGLRALVPAEDGEIQQFQAAEPPRPTSHPANTLLLRMSTADRDGFPGLVRSGDF